MGSLIDGSITVSVILCPLFLLLAVGGLIADYLMPRCPRLIRFLERVLHIDLGGNDYE